MTDRTPHISAHQFLDAFSKEWADQFTADPALIKGTWREDREWSRFMLAETGLLDSVRRRLQSVVGDLEYRREWYTIDAVYVGGTDLYRAGLTYPSNVYAIVEHENAGDLEIEMWKLLHWRVPLKVLICYDWPYGSHRRARWLDNKLTKLRDMRAAVDRFQDEGGTSAYVVLVGQRDSEDAPGWRYATGDLSSLQPL